MKLKYAKLNSDWSIERATVDQSQEEVIEALLAQGFLPYTTTSMPLDLVDNELSSYVLRYEQINDRDEPIVKGRWEMVEHDPQKVYAKIEKAKEMLANTDYMVIKNQELTLAGLNPEYDPVSLHTMRESFRTQIGCLEALLD